MKKGYKFKLEAVLKMRKLAEEQVKMQLGRVNVQIAEIQSDIKKQDASIDQAYESQEVGLSSGLDGQEIRFHPYFVQGKRAHIEQLKSEQKMLEAERAKLQNELNNKRADVKVIEKLREKDFKQYKDRIEKKRAVQLEEDVLTWFDRKRKGVSP